MRAEVVSVSLLPSSQNRLYNENVQEREVWLSLSVLGSTFSCCRRGLTKFPSACSQTFTLRWSLYLIRSYRFRLIRHAVFGEEPLRFAAMIGEFR